MKLADIYSQIAIQSGIEMVHTFSNSIPYCFKSAFTETLRITKTKDSLQPYFEDEISPLIAFESNILTGGQNGVHDFDISSLSDNPILVYNVTSAQNSISFRMAGLTEIDSIANNPNLQPMDGEGYWAKDGKRIRILVADRISPNVEIVYIKNPDFRVIEGTLNFDFENEGYGISFINAVIELAVSKLIEIAKKRGV